MWWWWIINIFFELFDIKINTAFATAHATSTAHISLGNLTPFDGEMPPHLDLHMTNNLYTFINTETVMSFLLIFRHYLHRKLSKCQFLVKPVIEIRRHFRISERYEFNAVLPTSVVYSFTVPHSHHMTWYFPVPVLSENAEHIILISERCNFANVMRTTIQARDSDHRSSVPYGFVVRDICN